MILPGVAIGNECIIAAGSIVTKNVEDGMIVGGNPAKIIGKTVDLMNKRKNQQSIPWNSTRREYEDFFFKITNEDKHNY